MNEIIETDRTQIRQTISRNSLSAQDKLEIKQAVLRHYTFKRSLTWKPETENIIHLLENQLLPEHFPRRKWIKFVIISQQEIDEIQQKKGMEFYQFEEIDVLRKSVDSFVAGKFRAYLTRKFVGHLPKHNNLKKEGNWSNAAYQCEKISGKWRIKKIGYLRGTQVGNPNLTLRQLITAKRSEK